MKGVNVNIAMKLRLYPNPDQTQHIYQFAGTARFVYNHALELRQNVYKTNGGNVDQFTINRHLTGLKKIMPWLAKTIAKFFRPVTGI